MLKLTYIITLIIAGLVVIVMWTAFIVRLRRTWQTYRGGRRLEKLNCPECDYPLRFNGNEYWCSECGYKFPVGLKSSSGSGQEDVVRDP